LKTNIFLLILAVFIVSLIITLNIFFQQNYQSEMAEQFNRQQLLIAKSVAKNIESHMEHIEEETLSFVRLLADRGLDSRNMEEFVNDAFAEAREEVSINLKIIDNQGRLKFSSSGESLTDRDQAFFREVQEVKTGTVKFIDLTKGSKKIVMLTPIGRSTGRKGALIVDVMLHTISQKFLASIKEGTKGHAWMMDGKGTLLYHPTQPQMVGKNIFAADRSCFQCHESFDVEKRILRSEDIGFSAYVAPYGEDKIIAFSKAKIADMTWIVCVTIPYSEVTFSIRKSMKLHSILVIFIFIATVASAFGIVVMNRQRIKAQERTHHLEMQRQLEKEIVQTKDYLENILESTESKIMVLDREMTIRTLNSAQERFCKRKKDDILGMNFFDVFPFTSENDRDKFSVYLKTCLDGVSHRVSDYSYVRDQDTLHINININPLVLHGEVSGIILSSNDVTEEVNLKEVLRDYAARLEELVKERTDELISEKEKLNAIVETVGAGIFLVDEQSNISWVNRTLRQWIGKEEGPITLHDIYGEHDLQQAIIDNRVLQEVVHHDFGRKGGYFQFTANTLVGPDGHMQTLVLVQDITDMKKMEEQMMHSEKVSALARISAGVAHEIGNPLTSISSYVQILREMEHDDFTRESLDTIAKHINRIADIVRQMSSFAKTTMKDLKYHHVRDLISMTLDLVKYDKRMKNIRITQDIPDDLPSVRVNETQCIQVFVNIILNAADAMLNEGALEIRAQRREHDVEIAFSDTGPGISEENMEKIFDPFFTTKEKGTGLGLAVSYNIIKGYQGDIIAENGPAGGTIFRVRVPHHEG
jgi:PAS domain S-box-containing protein